MAVSSIKSPLKYPGAKWRIAKWICSMMPEHRSYLEPFFGSGAVLFSKPRSGIETVNDLDGEVINLFSCIRRDPERLAAEIHMTPYARQVYEDAYSKHSEDPFGRAVAFYVRCNMGYGFRTTGERVGWKNDVQGRERAYAASQWAALPEQLLDVAERLRGVQIENTSAMELIPRFNYANVLIYADPPYLLGTRHGKQYRCEMRDRDHEQLLDLLLEHRGPVILSGYPSALYDSALHGWYKETVVSHTQTMSAKQEVLWMNFEHQTSLFEVR